MSKLAEKLRGIGVFNNYEILMKFGGPLDVAIEYTARPSGRMGVCEYNRTTVWSPHKENKKLDAPRRWGRQNNKEFHGNRAHSFPQALAWAREQFCHEYVPSPFGGYIPIHVLQKAREAAE